MKPQNKSLVSWKQDLSLPEIERQKNKCPLLGGSFYRLQSTLILEGHPPVSCPTLCNPMVCSPPGSSIHGILQARILERVAMSFSRGSSWPRDGTQVSCIAGRFFTVWVTRRWAYKLFEAGSSVAAMSVRATVLFCMILFSFDFFF